MAEIKELLSFGQCCFMSSASLAGCVPGAMVTPCKEPEIAGAEPTGPVSLRENTVGRIINSQLGVFPQFRPPQNNLTFVPTIKIKGPGRGVRSLADMDIQSFTSAELRNRYVEVAGTPFENNRRPTKWYMKDIMVAHATDGEFAMQILADGSLRLRVVGFRDVIMLALCNNLDRNIHPRHFKGACNYYFIADLETIYLNNRDAFERGEVGISWGTREGLDAVLTFITDCSIAGFHLYEWKMDCHSQQISHTSQLKPDPHEKDHSCNSLADGRLILYKCREVWVSNYLRSRLNIEVANIRQGVARASHEVVFDRLGTRVVHARGHTVGESYLGRTIECTFPCNRILAGDLLPRMIEQRDSMLKVINAGILHVDKNHPPSPSEDFAGDYLCYLPKHRTRYMNGQHASGQKSTGLFVPREAELVEITGSSVRARRNVA